MNLLKAILKWMDPRPTRVEKIVKECGCCCFCPKCAEPLNDKSFVSDKELVTYKCSECGVVSKWSFDIAPVPILISEEVE